MISFNKKLSTKFTFLVNNSQTFDIFRRKPCLLCSAITYSRSTFCELCRNDLEWNKLCCYRCAYPLHREFYDTDDSSLLCGECLISEPPFTHSIIPFPYSFPINRIIQGIKYKKERFWIKPFSHLFIEYLYTYQSNTPLPELLVAVPMHQKKLRQRGFNQAELLSNSMSKRLKIPTKTGALVKHKESINQASLGKEQRLKNLKGCFSIHDSACVEGKHIALVDDVMTTKATSELCSQLLIDAGAARVDIWSLARTTKNKSA